MPLDKTTYSKIQPEIGTKIFATHEIISDEPELLEVIGYSENERGDTIISYSLERCDSPVETHLSDMEFYPDADIDSKYYYSVITFLSDGYDGYSDHTIAFFFDADQALDYAEKNEAKTGDSHIVRIHKI